MRLRPGKVEETALGFRIEGKAYTAWGVNDAWQWWWRVDEPWIGGYVHPGEILLWERDGIQVDAATRNQWPLPVAGFIGPVGVRSVPWQPNTGVDFPQF